MGCAVKSILVRKVDLYRHVPYSDTIWVFDLTQIAKPSVNGWQFLIDFDRPNINKLRLVIYKRGFYSLRFSFMMKVIG